jgi:hypothetical protein
MMSAFILTEDEWRFATTGSGDAIGLVDKGLADFNGDGAAVLGRELSLVAREAASADSREIAPGVSALRGARFCMLVEPYPQIRGAIRIALCKDEGALRELIDERMGFESGNAAD